MEGTPLFDNNIRLLQLLDDSLGSVCADAKFITDSRCRHSLPLDHIMCHLVKQRVAAVPIKGFIIHLVIVLIFSAKLLPYTDKIRQSDFNSCSSWAIRSAPASRS